MESVFNIRESLLSVLNDDLNANYEMLTDAFREWRRRQDEEEEVIRVALGGAEQEAALTAFFAQRAVEPAEAASIAVDVPAPAPLAVVVEEQESQGSSEEVEVQVMAAGDDSQNSALEAAREMDALEEAQRSGDFYYAYDNDYDDRYDDGYGLDWNESGYFD